MRFIVLGFVAALSACATTPPSPAVDAAAPAVARFDSASVEQGVASLIDNWSRTGADGRWEDLKALYADDPAFVWIEDGRLAYESKAAAAAGVDRAAAMNATIKSLTDDVVVTPLSSDAALFRARFQFSFASADFSFDVDSLFSGVAVLRDGRWVFLHGHLSSPDAERN